LLFLAVFLPNSQAARYYVNAATGNDANTGTSWAQSFKTFQKAIEVAQNDDEIWLTGGTYCPSKNYFGQTYPTAGIYELAFFINKSLQIYGRFMGTETNVSQRNPANAPTIFSGDYFGDDLANPAQVESDIQGENIQRLLYMSNLPSNGKIRLDDVVVTASKEDGGLVIADGGQNIVITHCRFTGNFSAITGDYNIGPVTFLGSTAIGCYPKIDNCLFDHNGTVEAPGACNVWGANGPCKAIFTDCVFDSNTGAYAGGLSLFGANGACEAKLTGCTFSNNTVANSGPGGAISCYNSNLYGYDCSFDNNHAYYGGAISGHELIGDKFILLTNCSITDNSANKGGGIYLQSANMVLLGGLLYNNISQQYDGGGILIEPSFSPRPSTFDCIGVNFLYNKSQNNGGAICSLDPLASVQIERAKFYNNTANNGGAFYMDFTENSTAISAIRESIFNANEATAGSGGAIYVKQAPGTSHPGGLKVSSSTLFNNLCTDEGNQVFADNTSFDGNGLISWITAGTSGSGEFAGINASSIRAINSLVTAFDCASAGLTSCSGNIYSIDPQFIDPDNGNFQLEKCSPAVNTGEFTNQSFEDFEGNPRPYNDGTHRLDMGALEYQGTVTGCAKAICKNISVDLNASGTYNVPATSIDNGSTGCAALSYRINNQVSQTYNCDQVGTQRVTLKVTDCMNNSAACIATITIRETTKPTMLCKAVTLHLDAAGQATLSVAQIDNGSYDNCAIVTKVLGQSTFTCDNVGVNSVILGGVDASNNKGICTATVTLKDAITPLAKCKNITANLAANGTVTVVPNVVDNGSTDNCSLNLSLTPYSFNCGNIGVNNVTLLATDGSGNFSSCAATVTVKDVTAPNALCKNATVTLNDLGQGTLSIGQLNNGSSDACGIATMTLSKTQFNCSDIPGSSQAVTLTLKDVNNNQSSCTAQVTAKDNLAPTAICQNTTVHLGANGQVTVYPADLAANSFDNCSVTAYSPAAKVYTTANLGNNSLSITVKDWSGNGATCVSVVTVQPFTGLRGGGDRNEAQAAVSTEVFGFHVYPNPTAGDATVDFELAKNQSVALHVFDLTGRMVMSQYLEGFEGTNQVRLEMAAMPNGVYVVEIQGENVRQQKRLVVQHD
ncbi:MAG: T9SS type A sorting domain-containing protein, partial [Phycisphaerae bacterium]|nr:T9SS type A sorting domain-containing protein [Saprospiraceae bacterium]